MSEAEFIECPTCAAKPGSPVLCASCLARRASWYASIKKDETSPGFPHLGRPPREDYVRVTITFGRFTYEPAIEYRDGDNFDELAGILEGCALHASLKGNYWERKTRNAMDAARIVGGFIARGWPDRAYFVETWEEGKRGFAQVFQPFGVPRNR